MNGARSISMQKGYLLTALATAVLLAASSWTASAQVRRDPSLGDGRGVLITMTSKVDEGETATINVTVKGKVAEEATDAQVTVTITAPQASQVRKGSATAAEIDEQRDLRLGGALVLDFGDGPASDDDGATTLLTVPLTRRGTIELDTFYDGDAESEYVTLLVAIAGLENEQGTSVGSAAGDVVSNKNITITDVDTQIYTIDLVRGQRYEEGEDFMVEISADPEHVQANGKFRLRVADENGGLLKSYKVPPADTIVGSEDGMTTIPDVNVDERNTVPALIDVPNNDKNRVEDTITVELLKGSAGDYEVVDSVDVTLDDIHVLPDADAITAVARDAARNGKEVTEIMEGGDPVYLNVTVDRGNSRASITDETLMVDIKPADPAQVTDYTLSVSEVTFEGRETGKQSSEATVELKLSALSNDDVGMEYLMLDLVVSGVAANGTSTSTGTFSIKIVDATTPKVSPKSEAEAYPMIRAALGNDPQTTVMNPGESGTIMMGDLFTVMEGYDANYKVSESGGAVSVTAPDDTVTIAANVAGTSKVTVTATAEMMASSFKPEQTVSDVASITFEVMVEEEMPEPVPALPLFGQLLLALFMTAGGARLYRRRQG